MQFRTLTGPTQRPPASTENPFCPPPRTHKYAALGTATQSAMAHRMQRQSMRGSHTARHVVRVSAALTSPGSVKVAVSQPEVRLPLASPAQAALSARGPSRARPRGAAITAYSGFRARLTARSQCNCFCAGLQVSQRVLDTDAPVIVKTKALMASRPGCVSLAQGIVHWQPPPEAREVSQPAHTHRHITISPVCTSLCTG